MEEGIRALVFDAGLSEETLLVGTEGKFCIIPDRNQDMKGVVNLDAEINTLSRWDDEQRE